MTIVRIKIERVQFIPKFEMTYFINYYIMYYNISI